MLVGDVVLGIVEPAVRSQPRLALRLIVVLDLDACAALAAAGVLDFDGRVRSFLVVVHLVLQKDCLLLGDILN